MISQDAPIYEFGEFHLNPAENLLWRGSEVIPLPKRAFEMLLVLVHRSPHLVEKSELMDAVWKGVSVEEGNVAVIISMLRKTLSGNTGSRVYIETVSKRGYRFVADVRQTTLPSDIPVGGMKSAPVLDGEPPAPAVPIALYKHPFRFRTVAAWAGVAVVTLLGLVFIRRIPSLRASHLNQAEQQSAKGTNPAAQKSPVNEEAHQSYLAGRYYGRRRTQQNLYKSVEFYQQALLKDPQDAQAYSGLSDAYSSLATFETEPIQGKYSLAKHAAAKAVQLGGSLAETHTSLGIVLFRFEWNWAKAEAELRRAIELDSSSPTPHIILANCLSAQGRLDEALEESLRAVQLDPLARDAHTQLGRVYYWRREYDLSIAELHHAIDLDPYYARAHTRLGETYAVTGDYSNALREIRIATELQGSSPHLEGYAGYAESRSGDVKLARERLNRLLRLSSKEYVPGFSIALIYLGLREHEQAIYWLTKAYSERSEAFTFAFVDPKLDEVRSIPEFNALMSQMGLAEARRTITSSMRSDSSSNANTFFR